MFQKGSLLIYDNVGVCRVEDIGTPAGIPVSDKTKDYYTLTPLFGSGTIYIPVDTSVFMRPVISREEALELIHRIPEIREEAFESQNQKVLNDYYKAAFQTHECEDLLQLIRSIYTKQQLLATRGKKTGKTDQQYMKRAKDLLHEELAVALDLPVQEVESYIVQEMEKIS